MRTHKPLPQDELIKEQLAQLVADIKKPEEAFEFLSVFLTEAEVSMLARRVEIIKRLQDNQSYLTIQRELSVSSATVAAVAQLRDLPAVQNFIKKVQKRQKSGWFK